MLSTFVSAVIIKQMFGCLLNTEIKLSWRGEDCCCFCLGPVPVADASDLSHHAFLPSKMHSACGGAWERVAETRRMMVMT